MAAAGVRDILVANQVVGPAKAARLANLLRHADVIVTVDSLENAEELSTAASRKGQTLRVLVEVNVGMNRAGVQPGEPAVRLSGKVAALPGLRYVGLMGWEGHCAGIADAVEKRRAIETAVGALVETAERCRQAGLAVEIVSCGGTSTFQGDRAHPRRDRDPGGRRHLRRCPLSEPGGRSSSRAHRPQHGDQPAHADPGDRRRGSQGDECRRGASAAEGSGRGHGGQPLRGARASRAPRAERPAPGRGQARMAGRLRRHDGLPARPAGGDSRRLRRGSLARPRPRQADLPIKEHA